VEHLAQRLGVGSRQLTRLFARYLQASPSKVARTARVQRAKRLLDETILPMTEIAMRAGFGSLRRFNSVFAEVYGRPPTKLQPLRCVPTLPGRARPWMPADPQRDKECVPLRWDNPPKYRLENCGRLHCPTFSQPIDITRFRSPSPGHHHWRNILSEPHVATWSLRP
jgi:AraC-like DNA-binding protein